MPILVESSSGYTLITSDHKILKTYTFTSSDESLTNMLTLSRGEVPIQLTNFINDIKDQIIVGDKRLVHLIPNSTFDLESYRKARMEIVFSSSINIAHEISKETVGNYDNTDAILVRTYKALEDLDSNINLQCMRIREWYGFHFPELSNIINDNLLFIHAVMAIRSKENIETDKLKNVVDSVKCEEIVEAAKISVGSEMTSDDIEKIHVVCKSIKREFEFKDELSNYIVENVRKTMPNTCTLVDSDMLVCKLLAHAGSLSVLAKVPASTIQIYGAEKAYFGAVKTKSDTPKYGLIYHAPILANSEMKGKVARILAALICLAVKVDYYGNDNKTFGEELKERLKKRLATIDRSKKREKKVLKIGKHTFNNTRKHNADMDNSKRLKRK